MKRPDLSLVAIVVGLLFASPSLARQGSSRGDRNFNLHLNGRQVVPPVSSRAEGEVSFRLSHDLNSLEYKLVVANIDNVTAAHIHAGMKGTNGPVVVNLYPPAALSSRRSGRVNGVLAGGTITASDFVGPGAGYPMSALVEAIEAGEVYVDVHTIQYSEGEIRGQMRGLPGGVAPGEPPCPEGPLFTVLPVNASMIHHVTPIGSFNPPGHTVPSDHPGVSPTAVGVPLVSPGGLHINSIFRTTYLVSPFRQGTSDYGMDFAVCGTIRGRIAHMPSLADSLASLLTGGTCTSYSTADEDVESCDFPVDVHVSAGDSLGTASTVVGGGFDFGLYDDSHENYYVNPSRVHGGMLHAVCTFEYFEPTLREYLLSRVSDGTRVRTDEPRCGTMEIDVAGTAQGLWVMESNPVQVGGDESFFLSLALDTITPSTQQVLSVGSPLLGPLLMRMTTRHAPSRVNRAFSEVGPDTLIYCYRPDSGLFNFSYFVSLGSDGILSVERIGHLVGASPCNSVTPGSWTFSSNRVRFIR